MATERELLDKLVQTTVRVTERPVITPPAAADLTAMAEEEARRLALLRNPPRR